MSEKDFLPVESSRLSDFFPELKHFILANYSRTFTIKKGGQIPLADNPDELLYLATGKVKAYMFDDEATSACSISSSRIRSFSTPSASNTAKISSRSKKQRSIVFRSPMFSLFCNPTQPLSENILRLSQRATAFSCSKC